MAKARLEGPPFETPFRLRSMAPQDERLGGAPPSLRRDHPRRRRRRADVRRRRRAARAAGAAGRSCREAGQEDPDLGRRAVQLHQHRHRARSLPLGQPAFRPLGAGRYTAADFVALVERTASPGTRRRWASCSATARRGRSSTCCSANAARAASICAAGTPVTDVDMPTAASASRIDARRGHRARAGDRDRRAVDPQDGRDRLRLRSRAPLRAQGRRAAPGAGAADARRRRRAVPRAVGRRGRGRRARRPGRVPRGGAVHPPRAVGPGDPAGLVLLAARRAGAHRLPARPRRRRLAARRQARARRARRCADPRRRCPIGWPRRWRRLALRASSPTCPIAGAGRGGARAARLAFCRTAPKALPRPR